MQSGKQISAGWYVAADYLTAALAWFCFYHWRSWILKDAGAYPISQISWTLILLIVPAGWLMLYTLAGTYNHLYKKSRLAEFTLTFVCSLIGAIALFITFVFNDYDPKKRVYLFLLRLLHPAGHSFLPDLYRPMADPPEGKTATAKRRCLFQYPDDRQPGKCNSYLP